MATILNSRQEAKLNMYGVVYNHCVLNQAIVDTNLACKNAVAAFGAVIGRINSAAELVGAVLTGIAVDKSVSKNDLAGKASHIAGLIYAWASETGNNTLKQAVNFSTSDLLKIKDGEIAARCRTIHDAGVADLDTLKDYGVSQAKLDALQAAIDGYETQVPKPRAAIADRATRKANIKQMFKDADAILVERLDKLVENFKADNPDFVKTYKNSRVIVDPKSKAKPDGESGGGGGDNSGNVTPPA